MLLLIQFVKTDTPVNDVSVFLLLYHPQRLVYVAMVVLISIMEKHAMLLLIQFVKTDTLVNDVSVFLLLYPQLQQKMDKQNVVMILQEIVIRVALMGK